MRLTNKEAEIAQKIEHTNHYVSNGSKEKTEFYQFLQKLNLKTEIGM